MRRKLSTETTDSNDSSSLDGVVPNYLPPDSSSPTTRPVKKVTYHTKASKENDDAISHCSIGETRYWDTGTSLGSGVDDNARIFTNFEEEEIVILSPAQGDEDVVDDDRETAVNKTRYFGTIHFPLLTYLHWVYSDSDDTSYRIVLPKLPKSKTPAETLLQYINRSELSFHDKLQSMIATAYQLNKAIKVHKLVTIDPHLKNILFNAKHGAFLIDGGESAVLGDPIKSSYSRETQEEVEAEQRTGHTAPECWHLEEEEPPRATEAMDVYAFGMGMHRLTNPPASLEKLIELCTQTDPELRPTFELIIQLLELIAQNKHQVVEVILNYFAEHQLLRTLTNQEVEALIKLNENGLTHCCHYALKSKRFVKNLLQYDTSFMIKSLIALYQVGREDLYKCLKTNYNFVFELSFNWNDAATVSKIISSYGYEHKRISGHNFLSSKKKAKEKTPCNLYFFMQYDKDKETNKKIIPENSERWDIEPEDETEFMVLRTEASPS